MAVKVELANKEAAKQLKQNLIKAAAAVQAATRATAASAAAAIKQRGDADIAAGGNFSSRWQDALHVDIEETKKMISITTSMQGGPPMSYWRVFEYGAVITAKNPTGLLTWPNTSAFSINGKVPLFISKPSVTIPQKFHLRDIIAGVAKELKNFYIGHLR